MKKLLLTTLISASLFTGAAFADQESDMLTIAAEYISSDEIITSDVNFSSEYKAYNTYETSLNGYRFHVGQYSDGCIVITSLDGETKDFQGIYQNGVQLCWSTIIERHSNYYVHSHINGKVFTYKNKQIAKLY